jgi:hypothetical protein
LRPASSYGRYLDTSIEADAQAALDALAAQTGDGGGGKGRKARLAEDGFTGSALVGSAFCFSSCFSSTPTPPAADHADDRDLAEAEEALFGPGGGVDVEMDHVGVGEDGGARPAPLHVGTLSGKIVSGVGAALRSAASTASSAASRVLSPAFGKSA